MNSWRFSFLRRSASTLSTVSGGTVIGVYVKSRASVVSPAAPTTMMRYDALPGADAPGSTVAIRLPSGAKSVNGAKQKGTGIDPDPPGIGNLTWHEFSGRVATIFWNRAFESTLTSGSPAGSPPGQAIVALAAAVMGVVSIEPSA